MCTRLCQHDHITMTLVEDTQQRMELEKRPAAAPSTTLEALLPGRAEEAPAADLVMLKGEALAAHPPEEAAADVRPAGGDVPDAAGAGMVE